MNLVYNGRYWEIWQDAKLVKALDTSGQVTRYLTDDEALEADGVQRVTMTTEDMQVLLQRLGVK